MPHHTLGTGSLNLWARSSDFTSSIRVTSPSGVTVGIDSGSNKYGWTPSGEAGNSVLNIPLTESGSYGITISATGSYGNGNFNVIKSPGFETEFTWSGNHIGNLLYISSSNWLAMAGNNAYIYFYDPYTSTIHTTLTESFAAAYSKVSDRVYVWGSSGSTSYLYEFDNTGSFKISSSLSSSVGSGSVFWVGAMFYDDDKERLLFLRTNNALAKTLLIWDIATRTILTSSNLVSNFTVDASYGCYSKVNQTYYLSQKFGDTNYPFVKVDANTLAVTTTGTLSRGFLSYASESQVIISNGLKIIDPTTDIVVHTEPQFNTWIYEASSICDQCDSMLMVALDKGPGDPFTGVACFADDTYEPVDFLCVARGPVMESAYDMCFATSGSKVWICTNSGSGGGGNFLYSANLSRATASIIVP